MGSSMVDLIAKAPWASQEQMEMLSANLGPVGCMAQITFTDLAKGTLLNLAFGYAFEEIGWLLEDAGEGFNLCELCFAAGTPVHTEHGAAPIEKIKAGDKVWARNERTGAAELRTVTHIAPQHFDKLMELRVAGEKSALHPTPTHPFWARRNASEPAHWIDAGDLVAGEQIETQDGRWAAVQSVTPIKGLATVYNFTVEEDHDYFVGDLGLLVHNAGYDGKPPYSPDPVRWVNEGGTYSINEDGSWTYTDWEGNAVTYTNGYPDFSSYTRQSVEVPFSGDRGMDNRAADNAAEMEKLEGNVWHHVEDGKTMQEVPFEINQRFTHRGGFSLCN
jgi:hypothetical protein